MEYILGSYKRKLNSKNQITIPSEIIDVMRERNESQHRNKLYLMLDYAQGPSYCVPYVKCFDHTALETKVLGIIDAAELYRQKLDPQGRLCIPKDLVDNAELNGLDKILFVRAQSGNEWGLTFGIYDMDMYHKCMADKLTAKSLQKKKRINKK